MPSGERGAGENGDPAESVPRDGVAGGPDDAPGAVAAPDPNAALARTRLARQRSALALAAIAALLVHDGRLIGLVTGLLVGALAASTWVRRVSPGELTAATMLAAIAAAAVTLGV